MGFRRPGQAMEPIAFRWQSGRWSSVPVPAPVGAGATLADVEDLLGGAVWAVGARVAGGRLWPYAVERADGRWLRRDPPVDAREGRPDRAEQRTRRQPLGRRLASRRRGHGSVARAGTTPGGWTTLPITDVAPGQVVLTDIAVLSARPRPGRPGTGCPPDRVGFEPLLLAWDGSTWSSVALPWAAGSSVILHGVSADRNGALLLTGSRVARNNGRNRAFAARLVGGRWRRGLAPTWRYHNSELTDAAWIGSRPHLVGASATRSLYVTGCGTSTPARSGGGQPTQPHMNAEVATPLPAPSLCARRRTRSPRAESDRPEPSARRPTGVEGPSPPGGPRPQHDQPGTSSSATSRGGRASTRRARRGARWPPTSMPTDAPTSGWAGTTASGRTSCWPAVVAGTIDAAPAAFRLRDRHGCAAGDVDADGRTDLFCSIGANRGTNMTSDELWLAVGTRGRHQRTGDYGLVDPLGRGRTAVFLHLDADPYPQLSWATSRSAATPCRASTVSIGTRPASASCPCRSRAWTAPWAACARRPAMSTTMATRTSWCARPSPGRPGPRRADLPQRRGHAPSRHHVAGRPAEP